ncbi:MAG: hypothetical protein ACLUVS_03145 [Oscillospiraceae bacterium]|jgi:hypothetical protein
MFFIFPAHCSQQLFMPPAGAFLSIAKERSTVVSAGFQPFARRENRDASSKPPCCIRHRRCFGGFAYFLSLLTKSMPPETKKATGKSHPPEKKTSLHSDLLPKNPI